MQNRSDINSLRFFLCSLISVYTKKTPLAESLKNQIRDLVFLWQLVAFFIVIPIQRQANSFHFLMEFVFVFLIAVNFYVWVPWVDVTNHTVVVCHVTGWAHEDTSRMH